ncbi:hypothetical protein VPH35_033661 [Triticum aestivum]|uniref:Uncharacterized protein n=1 Tax=Aegilops tauschii TaxID=37682 RepID=R7W881_AEGTA
MGYVRALEEPKGDAKGAGGSPSSVQGARRSNRGELKESALLLHGYQRNSSVAPVVATAATMGVLLAMPGAVYVVLLGSPTGSITLVSSLREIPTVDVPHHPFLFGKIPTLF